MSGQKGAGTVVQSVDKAMVLLEILYREQRPMYLMELSDASAYPKSTTHALLATMCYHGVVRQYRDGRYFLGLKLAQYGQSVSPVWEISREIYPHLMQLAKAGGGGTGEGEGTGSGNGESQGEGGGDTGVGDDGDHSDSPTGGAENGSNTPTNSNQSNNTTPGGTGYYQQQTVPQADVTLRSSASDPEKETEETRRTAVYVQGEYGLQVHGAGSTHAQVLDVVGVENAAALGVITGGGGDEVTMDQMLLWDPEIVLVSRDGNYDEIYDDPLWSTVSAVQNQEVYEVPYGPYNWLDQPPSVQRVLGILWVGKVVYPDWYTFDMVEKTQEFYQLFWGYALSTQEAEELLANAMP